MIYVTLYLIAIVTANWAVATYGPGISVITAGVLIGFVIYARDCLHDAWLMRYLKRNMFLLIAAGSVITLALSLLLPSGMEQAQVKRIAVASFLAFAVSEAADTLVYHRLLRRPKLLRINGSNVVSAGVDSVIFPALAFGFPLLWPIMLGQFAAKVLGGGVWSLVIEGVRKMRTVVYGK